MNFAEAHACLWDQGDSKISQEEYVDNYQYVVSSLGVNQIEIADRSVSLEDNAIYLSLRIRYIADRFTLNTPCARAFFRRAAPITFSILPR